ncbi:MAG: TIGR03279 family radical SAM protein, partial [Cyanobacteriota bacterium]|nr:TIGR03279 family radical SAM protein [Cyanobacteriota bacterium]
MFFFWPGGRLRAQTESSCRDAVWNEPSAGVAVTALNPGGSARNPDPAVV